MTLCEIVEGRNITEFVEARYFPILCRFGKERRYTLETIPLYKYCVQPVAMCFVEGGKIYFELS